MGSAATPALGAEFHLSAGHSVVAGVHSESLVEPNLPQLLRNNKTDSLGTRGRG